MKLERIMNIIDELQKNNPYPEDIFPKIPCTRENLLNRREALFGAEGRRVYNMALDEVKKSILEESIDNSE